MLRTQVLLEPWQHRFLKDEARRTGKSLSAVLREKLSAAITPPQTRQKELFSIHGIVKDGQASGKEHDRYLYQHP